MAPDDTLFGAERLVLYLPAAVVTLQDLDGSRENRICKQAEKFLKSPASTFDKHPKEYVGQIKDRNAKTRAFATWCQNPSISKEACIVHDIYRKRNEAHFWRDIGDYNESGEEYFEKFSQLDATSYDEWKNKIKSASGTLVSE